MNKDVFKKVYNEAFLYDNHIVIDKIQYDCIVGKHCIWISDIEIKIPWVFNGKIEAFKDWDKGRNKDAILEQSFNNTAGGWDIESIDSIENEYNIFDLLSREKMAPPVNGFVYIENMNAVWSTSMFHCDPIGAIGICIKDATKLQTGKYSFEKFKELFLDGKQIIASDGALGDLQKQGNTVNGYLVDVRRTIWDMMDPRFDFVKKINWRDLKPDKEELKNKVLYYGQFPYQERKKAYQTFLMDGEYEDGTRQTLYRFDKMGIPVELEGKTVVDLGSQIGSVCAECYQRGARHITGIEYNEKYIECSRDLARYNHYQINYQCMNLNKVGLISKYIIEYYQNKQIDIIFLLSMYKHIGNHGFKILQQINESNKTQWQEAYIESNNCPDGYESKQAKEIDSYLMNAFWKSGKYRVEQIGMTDDRSPRCLWKIIKK